MSWLYAFKTFVVIWWIVLFVVLPFGQRSRVGETTPDGEAHAEEQGVSGGVVVRKLVVTTLLSMLVFAVFYVVTIVYGFGMDDFPQMLPGDR